MSGELPELFKFCFVVHGSSLIRLIGCKMKPTSILESKLGSISFLKVWDFEFGVWEFGVWCLGFEISSLEFVVWGWVLSLKFGTWGVLIGFSSLGGGFGVW